MKKFKRTLAALPAAMVIAALLPLGSVQTLRAAVFLEQEETAQEETATAAATAAAQEEAAPEEAEEGETQVEEAQTQESETEETEPPETLSMEEKPTEPETDETQQELSAEEPETEEVSAEPDSAEIEQNYAGTPVVKIRDNIDSGLELKNDIYVKHAKHTITLSGGSAAYGSYTAVSYIIYENTDEGRTALYEGLLEMPEGSKKSVKNAVEADYTAAGNYCIVISADLKNEDAESETKPKRVELGSHDFSIEKESQSISLRKTTLEISYGETVYIDDIAAVGSSYASDLEIKEDSGKKAAILEIGKESEKDYFKAVGMNDTEQGLTTVVLRLAETPFFEASEEKTLTVKVNPIELYMEAYADTAVYMYDTLAVEIILSEKQGNNIVADHTKELLSEDGEFCMEFSIKSDTEAYTVKSSNLNSEWDNSFICYIPVTREYFKEFSKGTKYSITAQLQYAQDTEKILPYSADAKKMQVRLLGRKAQLLVSAENDGVYDYRTCYGAEQPTLSTTLIDTTGVPGEEAALSQEAGQIRYYVSSSDEAVAAVDGAEVYTAENMEIPVSIHGVGTTTLTVKADGSSVYTVNARTIELKVKDSPLFDEDFAISISGMKNEGDREFCADSEKTGFEKWEEYLEAHDNWLNASVSIILTEKGKDYYDRLCLSENGQAAKKSETLTLADTGKMAEYVLWAENSATNADTSKAAENGTRSFTLGIDTDAPEISSWTPSTDYYAPASTEDKQYFPKSFVLEGRFTDAASGVAAVEYTTDINAADGAEWTPLTDEGGFSLTLENGVYNAIALRAEDTAGNVSAPVCLKNENGDFIQIIVDDTSPDIMVSAVSDGSEYSAENEQWTNAAIEFCIAENTENSDSAESHAALEIAACDIYAGLYGVEYSYQSIADVLCGEPIDEESWQELSLDGEGAASLFVGENPENPVNRNGCYYFRGISRAGIKSEAPVQKRILLWQNPSAPAPLIQTGASEEDCHNGWYNMETGTPIIDFAYPEYDAGAVSGEYAAPITIHCNLKAMDEKENTTILADDKTATIRAYTQDGKIMSESDDLSQMQTTFDADGIYTLEYRITDAAGNESETQIYTYNIDCSAPTNLQIKVGGEERPLENESTLVYDRFYQSSVSGEASAEYGISGKESLKLLKAKAIGEWEDTEPGLDAEQFTIEPNTRCLLYIRAVDGAGNMAEGWTRGLVADSEAPAGQGGGEMIIEPEGANEHGFFNKDIKVSVSIQDLPAAGDCAALELVSACVGTDGADTISEKELFFCAEETVSEALIAETECFTCVETIDASANEGNEAYITVNAVDRCGNMSTYTQELKIDVTKPEIEISFDREDAANGRYYAADRRAKINIRELNFDSSLVEITAERNGEEFTPSISEWHSEKKENYAYVDFNTDGDYTLTVNCTDLAGNEAKEVSTELFTIDKTAPRVTAELEARESDNARKGYYSGAQTAVITVTEHNFRADDFRIDVQPSARAGSWEHKNDTHVIKLELLEEGDYAVSCSYQDLAGNDLDDGDKAKLPLTFVVDRTAPAIEISGVQDNSANAGEVVPVISVRDANAEQDAVKITLTTGRGESCDIAEDIGTAPTEGGFAYTLNGLDVRADDIYYLTVDAVDMAGNQAELTYRFSLNRRGSAYELTDMAGIMEQYYNSYDSFEDITIMEMNVDRLEDFALYLSYNTDVIYGRRGGRPSALTQGQQPESVLYDVEVSGNEDTGYIYTYTLYRENFAAEGTYRIGVYSRDKAGNEVNNLLRLNGEEIQFIIDNTPPRVVIDGVESNRIYDVESRRVSVVADDNFKLAEAELLLVNKDNETLESWDYFDLANSAGDTAVITIGEYNEEISLLDRAADAAGNRAEALQGESQAKEEFLVTTDKLVQLVNKPMQAQLGRFLLICAAAAAICAALLVFLSYRKVRPIR
ncbi:MAG: Ig-like domain-containing protein [Lachnospiraceae bacterium]|nr:Ig-like domain-containing protein [Lachnospiraceae bacterium]